MSKNDHVLIRISIIITVILIVGLATQSYARMVSMPHSSANSPGFNAPPPYVVPVTQPPWFPHSFQNIWSADDVVKVLNEQSLEVEAPEFITETDRFGLPATTKELIKFSMPSIGKGIQGCILIFELKDNLNKNKNYYSALNDKGHPHTWSFLKDNILLVIDGAVPEEKAKQYESALTGLKQK